MPPIFKNADVTIDDIGDFMRNHLKDSNTEFTKKRYLIGSMFGIKILLITPLLQFYMKHDVGLILRKVYQIIQFDPRKCFKTFADNVSNDRRAGWSNTIVDAEIVNR